VVEPPDFDAVPVTRPELSRNVVEFPEVDDVPVTRPVLSRNVVVLPDVDTDPVVLPVLSVSVPRSPFLPETPICLVALSLPGGRGFGLVSAKTVTEFAMTVTTNTDVSNRLRILSPLLLHPE